MLTTPKIIQRKFSLIALKAQPASDYWLLVNIETHTHTHTQNTHTFDSIIIKPLQNALEYLAKKKKHM